MKSGGKYSSKKAVFLFFCFCFIFFLLETNHIFFFAKYLNILNYIKYKLNNWPHICQLFFVYLKDYLVTCLVISLVIELSSGINNFAPATDTRHGNGFVQNNNKAPGGAYTIHDTNPGRRGRAIIEF